MTTGRYYSRGAVSALLASLVETWDGQRVLDLCSGGGALGRSLLASNHGIDLLSVDLDSDATCPGLLVADALSPGLDVAIGVPPGFDAVLCNPPYGTIADAPYLRGLAEGSGIPHAVMQGRLLDAAWTFSAQALRLARSGAQVALVLPDGLVTGRKAAAFRAGILSRHAVTHVVSLPENAFDDTRARAFLVILRKDGASSRPILLSSMDRDGVSTPELAIPPEAAACRLDHGHHAVMVGASGPTLASFGAEAIRGRVDPSEAKGLHGTVFHTSSFPPGDGRRRHALPLDGGRHGHPMLARAGDILVARVHRSLHTKVCLVASGEAPPTGFVLRLRLPRHLREPVVDALISAEGEARLQATARGTGARTLAAADLMAMPIPLRVPFAGR